jgi:hypothetical protein
MYRDLNLVLGAQLFTRAETFRCKGLGREGGRDGSVALLGCLVTEFSINVTPCWWVRWVTCHFQFGCLVFCSCFANDRRVHAIAVYENTPRCETCLGVVVQKADQFCDQAKDYFRRVLKQNARNAYYFRRVYRSVPIYVVHMTMYRNIIIFSNSKFRCIQMF